VASKNFDVQKNREANIGQKR